MLEGLGRAAVELVAAPFVRLEDLVVRGGNGLWSAKHAHCFQNTGFEVDDRADHVEGHDFEIGKLHPRLLDIVRGQTGRAARIGACPTGEPSLSNTGGRPEQSARTPVIPVASGLSVG